MNTNTLCYTGTGEHTIDAPNKDQHRNTNPGAPSATSSDATHTAELPPTPAQTKSREPLARRVKKPADFSYEDRRNTRPIEELRPFQGERACHSHLLVGKSTIPGVEGEGLFLGGSKVIFEGKVLGLYTGERFSDKEKALEYGRAHGTANKVFAEMPTNRFKMKFVVARPDECPAALINDPLVHGAANVEIRTNLATGKNELIALRDIHPGEELLMEYGPGCWDGLWELASVGDILGAYPELTDSYRSWQLQKMYDEGLDVEEDLYCPDEDHLRRDTDDEQEDDGEGFSTPPSEGSHQSVEPQAPPRTSTGGTLTSPSQDQGASRPDLVSTVDTPCAVEEDHQPDFAPTEASGPAHSALNQTDPEFQDPSFTAVASRTKTKYLKYWNSFTDYAADVSLRLDTWEHLPRQTVVGILVKYVKWLRQRSLPVKPAFTALAKGLSERGHSTTLLYDSAVSDAKNADDRGTTQREKSKKKEDRLRSAIPFEFVRNIALVGYDSKPDFDKMVATCSLLMYDKSKRSCTVTHTHNSSKTGDEDKAITADDVILMDSTRGHLRYDPLTYRRAVLRYEQRKDDPGHHVVRPSFDYVKVVFRADKDPQERTAIWRRTSLNDNHGSPLEDILMDRIGEVCVMGAHESLNDMFFSMPSASARHDRRKVCASHVTAPLKAQAAAHRLPTKHFSSHCYRITGRTNAAIANEACNHLITQEAALNLQIGWTAGSTSAPRYIRPSYMGHSNLRQVSTGNPDNYVTLSQVILSLPMPASDHQLEDDSEDVEMDDQDRGPEGISKEAPSATLDAPTSRAGEKRKAPSRTGTSKGKRHAPASRDTPTAAPPTRMTTRGSGGKKPSRK